MRTRALDPRVVTMQSILRNLRANQLSEDRDDKARRSTPKHLHIKRLFRVLVLFPLAFAIALTVAVLAGQLEWLILPGLTACALALIGVCVWYLLEPWYFRAKWAKDYRDPLAGIFLSTTAEARRTSLSLNRLSTKSVSDLEFAVLNLKGRREALSLNIGSAAGVVRTIGVFPAMMVALAAAATAMQQPNLSPFHWALAGVASGLVGVYPLAGIALERLAQLDRGIAVLEHVIKMRIAFWEGVRKASKRD